MDVESVLARRILQLANQILRNRNEDLKELEITAEQADALRFFQGHPGCSAVDLKAHLGITHQAARAIVERMAARGLVQTEVSKTDARYRDVRSRRAAWKSSTRCRETARTWAARC